MYKSSGSVQSTVHRWQRDVSSEGTQILTSLGVVLIYTGIVVQERDSVTHATVRANNGTCTHHHLRRASVLQYSTSM